MKTGCSLAAAIALVLAAEIAAFTKIARASNIKAN